MELLLLMVSVFELVVPLPRLLILQAREAHPTRRERPIESPIVTSSRRQETEEEEFEHMFPIFFQSASRNQRCEIQSASSLLESLSFESSLSSSLPPLSPFLHHFVITGGWSELTQDHSLVGWFGGFEQLGETNKVRYFIELG